MMPINWLSLSDAQKQLGKAHYDHLADNGSLTRRVRTACQGQFKVKLINHCTVQPNQQERKILKLDAQATAISRQVFLCCDLSPQIFARTIIALTLGNKALTDRIAVLGGQSLGSLLFRDPLAKKLQMQLAVVPVRHSFFKDAALSDRDPHDLIWVRRSLYEYEGCELIVYEAFIDFPYDSVGIA